MSPSAVARASKVLAAFLRNSALSFEKAISMRVEIGRVWRQEQHPCPALSHQIDGPLAHVEADIVEDDDVPGRSSGASCVSIQVSKRRPFTGASTIHGAIMP